MDKLRILKVAALLLLIFLGGAVAGILLDRHYAPRIALTMALVLHEMTTNAAKYGALSSPAGRLRLAWTLRRDDPDGDAPVLDLAWEESGGPPVVAPPSRQGFGTRMIERGLARQLAARVETEWRPEGLRFRLSMPLREGVAGPEPGLAPADAALLG